MPCRQNFFYGKNASSPSKINGLVDFYANFNPQIFVFNNKDYFGLNKICF